jgi:hypothetical protein
MRNKSLYVLITLILIIIIITNIVGCSEVKNSKDFLGGLIFYTLVIYKTADGFLSAPGKSDKEIEEIQDYRDSYGDDYKPALIADSMRRMVNDDRALDDIFGTSKPDATLNDVANLDLPSNNVSTADEGLEVIPDSEPTEVIETPADPPELPSDNNGSNTDEDTLTPVDPDKQSGGDQGQDQQPKNTPEDDDDNNQIGAQEQPSGEFDVFTYYEPDIVEGANIQSITITVNIETLEVYGNHHFEGNIGEGYRTADYEFNSYLDASNSFSVVSIATIYEDGQDIGEGTLKIMGQLSNDMSYIYGQIIDEAVGYGVEYYAELVTQSSEDPQTENY